MVEYEDWGVNREAGGSTRRRRTVEKTLTFYELLGDARAASPRLSDLGRTIGRLRGFSASFPRTGHDGPTRPKIATLARKNQHRINAHDALDDLDDSRI